MKNLFEQSRSHWVRYDRYELKTAADGKRYITPGKNAKPDIYNPLKEAPGIVLDALNVGMLMMNRSPEDEVQKAILEFVTHYGLLGLMTALPTTPPFMDYEAVYLPKNHFIKAESMETEDYLALFYPFDQLDVVKRGVESSWSVSGDRTIVALTMTFADEPMAKTMLSFLQHIHNTQSLTAQSKWILRTGRNQNSAKGTYNSINLVCQGNNSTSHRSRLAIPSKTRHIMLINSLSYGLGFAIQQSIFTAHYTLQLSKFDNHTCNQVSFSKECSTLQLFFINLAVKTESNHVRSLNKALALVIHIAQTFLEGYGFQLLQTSFLANLQVFIKEEFSIAQTSAKNAFIAMSNYIQMLCTTITNSNKTVQQIASFSKNREITLMLTHRSNDAFLGQGQEFLFKITAQSSRPFNKIVNLFKQVFVNLSMTAYSKAHFSYLLANQLTTSVLIHHNKVFIKNLFIVISTGNLYCTVSFHDSRSNSIFNLTCSFTKEVFSSF